MTIESAIVGYLLFVAALAVIVNWRNFRCEQKEEKEKEWKQ